MSVRSPITAPGRSPCSPTSATRPGVLGGKICTSRSIRFDMKPPWCQGTCRGTFSRWVVDHTRRPLTIAPLGCVTSMSAFSLSGMRQGPRDDHNYVGVYPRSCPIDCESVVNGTHRLAPTSAPVNTRLFEQGVQDQSLCSLRWKSGLFPLAPVSTTVAHQQLLDAVSDEIGETCLYYSPNKELAMHSSGQVHHRGRWGSGVFP